MKAQKIQRVLSNLQLKPTLPTVSSNMPLFKNWVFLWKIREMLKVNIFVIQQKLILLVICF